MTTVTVFDDLPQVEPVEIPLRSGHTGADLPVGAARDRRARIPFVPALGSGGPDPYGKEWPPEDGER
ncbi:hypothetical protein ACFQLX_05635 [Streptomyces polyrhachis]|uniref:Uncharacterized protein n=1 Tax=Streptomyces polyrhachis TaxID=1282885 RepID=A0ABW2GA80_9ACTN